MKRASEDDHRPLTVAGALQRVLARENGEASLTRLLASLTAEQIDKTASCVLLEVYRRHRQCLRVPVEPIAMKIAALGVPELVALVRGAPASLAAGMATLLLDDRAPGWRDNEPAGLLQALGSLRQQGGLGALSDDELAAAVRSVAWASE